MIPAVFRSLWIRLEEQWIIPLVTIILRSAVDGKYEDHSIINCSDCREDLIIWSGVHVMIDECWNLGYSDFLHDPLWLDIPIYILENISWTGDHSWWAPKSLLLSSKDHDAPPWINSKTCCISCFDCSTWLLISKIFCTHRLCDKCDQGSIGTVT